MSENTLDKINFVKNLKVGTKLAAALGVSACLIIFLFYTVVTKIKSDIEFIEKERFGVEYAQPAFQIIKNAQIHRGLGLLVAKGDDSVISKLKTARDNVNKGFSKLDAINAKHGELLKVNNKYRSLKNEWNTLVTMSPSDDTESYFDNHSKFIADISNLLVSVADASNLTLDARLDSYYLMNLVFFNAPIVAENLGLLRAKAAALSLVEGGLSPLQIVELGSQYEKGDISPLLADLSAASNSEDATTALKRELSTMTKIINEPFDTFANQVNKVLEGTHSKSGNEIFGLGTVAINALYEQTNSVVTQLDTILVQRIDELKAVKLQTEAITTVVLLIVLYIGTFTFMGIMGALKVSSGALSAIRDGKYDQAVSTTSRDEFGKMINAIEDMRKDLAARIETDKAQADANARIKQALDCVTTCAMVADQNNDIIYTNDAVDAMLKNAENSIRQDLPDFDADNIIGKNIDVFHKNPVHQQAILSKLESSYQTQILIGGLTFNLIATPIMADSGERLGTVVEWKDITQELARLKEEKAQADANARVKQALDCVTTCAMVADENNDIIYTNEAVDIMLKNAESALRKDLPQFDASNIVGKNIDVFHKNPAHQQALLSKLTSTYSTEILVGGLTFGLIATPIINDDGDRLGTVVEWKNRTAELETEQEVESIIEAASKGDLSVRVSEEGKEGFYKSLAQGLNQIVEISEGVIGNTVDILDALAHGDLTKRIETDYEGTFDKLKRDANATADKLTDVIGRIEDAANTVATGAEEIAQGNTDLSQRTEEQASSLEETASSMEEMTSTVRQNADNARTANVLAQEAETKASSGGEIVSKAVSSMAEINDSSKKISDIIGVIDEIAFQTNLLALNAAVEAARAGEQGRGFAVVAGEVRNLAQRSAAAAKEIKDLIRDSVTKVEDGTSLVNQSGEMLNEIVESVRKVNQTIADISVASEEQSSGIEQVNKAVSQMDEMTQQNAALVEEASAAGESMSEQAREMKQLLSFFQLHQMIQQPAISAPAQAAPVRLPSQSATQPTAKRDAVVSDDEEWEEF